MLSLTVCDGLSTFFFQKHHAQLHASKEALSKLTGVSPDLLESKVGLLANVFQWVDREDHIHFQQTMASTGATLIAFAELNRYDETPLRIRHRGPPPELADVVPGSHEPQSQPHGQGVPSLKHRSSLKVPLKALATVSKVFAVESKYWMLVRIDPTTPDEEVAFYAFKSTGLNLLHLVDKATAPTFLTCLKQSTISSEHTEGFKFKVRATTTDQAPSNYNAEQGVMASRPGWSSLHLPCNMHILARSFSKTFALLDDHITGMVNFSLSLCLAGNFQKFRQSLIDLVARRLVIVRGAVSLEAQAYRSWTLDLFCAKGRNIPVKRFLLSHFLNGDWRKKDCIEVFCPPGVQVDQESILANVTTAVLLSLSGSLFRLYPRHRWMGADTSLDQLGLCESVHGLASAAFKEVFCPTQEAEPAATSSSALHPGSSLPVLEDDDAARAPRQARPQARAAQGEASFAEAAATEDDPGSFGEAGIAEEEDMPTFQELNAKRQGKAANWLATDPLPYLQGMRLCMKPLSTLMDVYLLTASEAWETQQRANLSKGLTTEEAPQRESQLMAYLSQDAERMFMADLTELLTGSDWQHLQTSCWTRGFQAHFFRVTSRMGCLIHQLLRWPTTLFPWQLFHLLVDEQASVQRLQGLRPCLLDPFSRDFLAAFPGEQLGSAEARATLDMLAGTVATETIGVEWSHGRVSRLLKSQSQQTHTPTLSFTNAQVLCQKQRQRWGGTCAAKAQKLQENAQARGLATTKAAAPKQRRGGGGAWRAFTSMQTRGQSGRVDFASLGQQFRALQETGGQPLATAQEYGQAGTERHRLTGQPSFGEPTRQMMRRRRRLVQSSTEVGQGTPLADELLVSTSTPGTLALNQDLSARLTEVRRQALRAAKQKKDEQQQHLQELQRFVEEAQGPTLEKLFEKLPDLVPFANSLNVEPSSTIHVIEAVFDNEEKTRQIASWALKHTRSSNVKRVLDKSWADLNTMVVEADQPAMPPKGPKEKRCAALGCCVCTSAGKAVMQVRNQFLRLLKAHYPRKDSGPRKLLSEGFLVVEVLPKQATAQMSSWSELTQEADAEDVEDQPVFGGGGSLFLHLGLHYFKPYRPTFQTLSFVHETDDGLTTLKQTGQFFTEFELWSSLNLDREWDLRWLEIIATEAPVGQLDPSTCFVRAALHDVMPLWTGPAKQRRKRGARKQKDTKAKATKVQPSAASQISSLAQEAEPHVPSSPEVDASGPSEEEQSVHESQQSDEGSEPEDDALDQLLQTLFHDEEDSLLAPAALGSRRSSYSWSDGLASSRGSAYKPGL